MGRNSSNGRRRQEKLDNDRMKGRLGKKRPEGASHDDEKARLSCFCLKTSTRNILTKGEIIAL